MSNGMQFTRQRMFPAWVTGLVLALSMTSGLGCGGEETDPGQEDPAVQPGSSDKTAAPAAEGSGSGVYGARGFRSCWQGCEPGESCVDGMCSSVGASQCVPSCYWHDTPSQCGSDGCGGSCGTCPSGQMCFGDQCVGRSLFPGWGGW